MTKTDLEIIEEAIGLVVICDSLNEHIYTENPGYYGDYYVTMHKGLNRTLTNLRALRDRMKEAK